MKLHNHKPDSPQMLPQVLVISSYPPRVCGIATYSQDLIIALNSKFGASVSIKVCALESEVDHFNYTNEVEYILHTSDPLDYSRLAQSVNQNSQIKLVLVQHEFGLFEGHEGALCALLSEIRQPVIIVFHSVIPLPNEYLKLEVQRLVAPTVSIVVMTRTSAKILENDYDIDSAKITVIAHGTHLVPHLSKEFLKQKYGLTGKMVLTTFGLLSAGKSIETTLESLPEIIKNNVDVVFLVIGKTHPMVIKWDGEVYREMLEHTVVSLKLQNHVRFINHFVALPDLLEYLQLTDIYLFTTNDPHQAVSGTFAYAMSCACPIISTPIPHAREVLTEDTGIIFDFRNAHQLAEGVILLLNDEPLRRSISSNTLQKIVSTAWENSAVAHALLFEKKSAGEIALHYSRPAINLNHVKSLTTEVGIIQFSKINQPDLTSGYTLDDNARALIAMCMLYEQTGDAFDVELIEIYLRFIGFCQQPEGDFLNYVDKEGRFTDQNAINLDDSNGRAIWALGYLISRRSLLPAAMISRAEIILSKALPCVEKMHSTRAMAFAIKGLYYFDCDTKLPETPLLVTTLANRLAGMFKHEASEKWLWFESYLTYANSALPEAMLCAWMMTGEALYLEIARKSFDFLLSSTFNENGIEVISNKGWLTKGEEAGEFGEQPIDVACTIMTLRQFYEVLKDEKHLEKLIIAFDWFLGKNRLHQIVYNPCTGGCYDGLEETHVNLNQGAESTISYLLARVTIQE